MDKMIEIFEVSVKKEFFFLLSEFNFQISRVERHSSCISMSYESDMVQIVLSFSFQDHEISFGCGLKKLMVITATR